MNNEEFQKIVLEKLDGLEEGVSRIEINTADNWSDIAKLKSIKWNIR